MNRLDAELSFSVAEIKDSDYKGLTFGRINLANLANSRVPQIQSADFIGSSLSAFLSIGSSLHWQFSLLAMNRPFFTFEQFGE